RSRATGGRAGSGGRRPLPVRGRPIRGRPGTRPGPCDPSPQAHRRAPVTSLARARAPTLPTGRAAQPGRCPDRRQLSRTAGHDPNGRSRWAGAGDGVVCLLSVVTTTENERTVLEVLADRFAFPVDRLEAGRVAMVIAPDASAAVRVFAHDG